MPCTALDSHVFCLLPVAEKDEGPLSFALPMNGPSKLAGAL